MLSPQASKWAQVQPMTDTTGPLWCQHPIRERERLKNRHLHTPKLQNEKLNLRVMRFLIHLKQVTVMFPWKRFGRWFSLGPMNSQHQQAKAPFQEGFLPEKLAGRRSKLNKTRMVAMKKKEGAVNTVGREKESCKISQNKLMYFWSRRERQHTMDNGNESRKKQFSNTPPSKSSQNLICRKVSKEKD